MTGEGANGRGTMPAEAPVLTEQERLIADQAQRITELEQLVSEQELGRIMPLEKKLARALAENQVWRELVTEVRELATHHFQGFVHSKAYKRVQQCMAHQSAMDAAVDAVLRRETEKQEKNARADASVEP